MSEPLEHEYFKWLYSQVSDVLTTDPYLTYDYLFGRLHRTRFVPLVSGDDNRAQDGKDLRLDFFNEIGYRDEPFLKEDASVFEVLIAFSRRASFETDDSPQAWFWLMLNNLGIAELTDAYPKNDGWLTNILDVFVNRLYDHNGNGGLFPMNHTINDQRRIEIWYQFSEYLVDHEYL